MKLLTRLLMSLCIILLPSLSHAHFKLCEFAGSYIGSSSSAGGNTIVDPETESAATTSIVQFDLDKHGKGRANFLSATVFFDPDNVVLQKFTPVDSSLTIEINLTFPSIGVGELVIYNYPRAGSVLRSDFVAKKDHSKGHVTELLLNILKISGGNPPGVLRSPSIITVTRQ